MKIIEFHGTSQKGQFRIIYVARFKNAIHVLHAFQKKTQKTALIKILAVLLLQLPDAVGTYGVRRLDAA